MNRWSPRPSQTPLSALSVSDFRTFSNAVSLFALARRPKGEPIAKLTSKEHRVLKEGVMATNVIMLIRFEFIVFVSVHY